jgi:hypothetical protein
VAFTQPAFAQRQQAFEPLVALKTGIVLMPLLVPRRWWLSLTVMALLALEGVTLFYADHIDWLRALVPMSEPWTMLPYLVIGCALVATREHRRVASLRRLRAEREIAVLTRQSALSLGLLDKMGSPMQVLTISVELLMEMHPDDEQLRRVDDAVRAVAVLRDRISAVGGWEKT